MNDDFGEPPSCYWDDIRKARKEHKCIECGGVIRAGELYHYRHGAWDRSRHSYKVCVDCEALRTACQGVLESEVPSGYVYVAVFECEEIGHPELRERFREIRKSRGKQENRKGD